MVMGFDVCSLVFGEPLALFREIGQ
jgi:hypothetical protein